MAWDRSLTSWTVVQTFFASCRKSPSESRGYGKGYRVHHSQIGRRAAANVMPCIGVYSGTFLDTSTRRHSLICVHDWTIRILELRVGDSCGCASPRARALPIRRYCALTALKYRRCAHEENVAPRGREVVQCCASEREGRRPKSGLCASRVVLRRRLRTCPAVPSTDTSSSRQRHSYFL